jgi:hypothetical protein
VFLLGKDLLFLAAFQNQRKEKQAARKEVPPEHELPFDRWITHDLSFTLSGRDPLGGLGGW